MTSLPSDAKPGGRKIQTSQAGKYTTQKVVAIKYI
jgi:hypothetical protein